MSSLPVKTLASRVAAAHLAARQSAVKQAARSYNPWMPYPRGGTDEGWEPTWVLEKQERQHQQWLLRRHQRLLEVLSIMDPSAYAEASKKPYTPNATSASPPEVLDNWRYFEKLYKQYENQISDKGYSNFKDRQTLANLTEDEWNRYVAGKDSADTVLQWAKALPMAFGFVRKINALIQAELPEYKVAYTSPAVKARTGFYSQPGLLSPNYGEYKSFVQVGQAVDLTLELQKKRKVGVITVTLAGFPYFSRKEHLFTVGVFARIGTKDTVLYHNQFLTSAYYHQKSIDKMPPSAMLLAEVVQTIADHIIKTYKPLQPVVQAPDTERPSSTEKRVVPTETAAKVEILDKLLAKRPDSFMKAMRDLIEDGKTPTENQLKAIRMNLYKANMRAEADSFRMG